METPIRTRETHPVTTARYIEHNRRALLRLLATLFAMVGGGSVKSLPRAVYNRLVGEMRPAEAALRRLIVVMAREVEVVLHPARSGVKAPLKQRDAATERSLAFPLFDRRKRFDAPRRASVQGPGPRMFVIGVDDYVPYIAPPEPTPEDPIDAATVCKRLKAFEGAVNDLPKQAHRLARLIARRKAAKAIPRLIFPLRGGWPPGYRKRHRREVHEILGECDWLVRWSEENPA